MSELEVKDQGGEIIKMINFGAYRSSYFGRSLEYIVDVNRELPTFQFRDDDVLLVSYPKAGCTWTYEILTMLLKGNHEGPTHSKMYAMLEACSKEDLESLSSPRLLNTHLPYRRIPSDIQNHPVKIVYVVRNPKDIAVSLYNMMSGMKHYGYKGTFHNWLPLFVRGDLAYDDFFRHTTDWERVYNVQQHNILLVFFEDMKKDSLREIKRMARFLDLHYDDLFLKNLSEKCQFKQMKTRYTKESLGRGQYKEDANVGFMRKGEVGNWKEWFTVSENEMMDTAIETGMKESKLDIVYESI